MDSTFLKERIEKTKLQIIAFEDASLALANDGVQSYTLDTGQTTQKVTKLELEWIQKNITALYNRLATLEARLQGSGTIARPAW